MQLKCFSFYKYVVKIRHSKILFSQHIIHYFSEYTWCYSTSNSNRFKLYKSLWVLIMSLFKVSSSVITCRYTSDKSSFENTLPSFSKNIFSIRLQIFVSFQIFIQTCWEICTDTYMLVFLLDINCRFSPFGRLQFWNNAYSFQSI